MRATRTRRKMPGAARERQEEGAREERRGCASRSASSQPALSVAYVPRAVSALRDSGRSGAAAAAVVQDGRILGIARVFRLE